MADQIIDSTYRKTRHYKISRYRMPYTYLLAILAIVFAPANLYAPAFLIVGAGILMRLWAAGHVVKLDTLTTGGPYALTRNPLYFGTFLCVVGMYVLTYNWWLLLAAMPGFILFYGSAIRWEEDYLAKRYGDKHKQYRMSVPMFIPRIPRLSELRRSHFSLKTMRSNGEHRNFFWLVVVGIVIYLR